MYGTDWASVSILTTFNDNSDCGWSTVPSINKTTLDDLRVSPMGPSTFALLDSYAALALLKESLIVEAGLANRRAAVGRTIRLNITKLSRPALLLSAWFKSTLQIRMVLLFVFVLMCTTMIMPMSSHKHLRHFINFMNPCHWYIKWWQTSTNVHHGNNKTIAPSTIYLATTRMTWQIFRLYSKDWFTDFTF